MDRVLINVQYIAAGAAVGAGTAAVQCSAHGAIWRGNCSSLPGQQPGHNTAALVATPCATSGHPKLLLVILFSIRIK